jgi:hypothetical protein
MCAGQLSKTSNHLINLTYIEAGSLSAHEAKKNTDEPSTFTSLTLPLVEVVQFGNLSYLDCIRITPSPKSRNMRQTTCASSFNIFIQAIYADMIRATQCS